MSAEAEARTKMRQLAELAKDIPGATDMTWAEKAAKLEKIEADLQEASSVISVSEKAKRLAAGSAAEDEGFAGPVQHMSKSMGQFLIESDAYKAAASKIGSAGSFHSSLEIKANTIGEGTNTGDVMQGQGGAVILPNYLPGIVEQKFQPLVVADLLPQGSTDSPVIVYVTETYNNQAGNVSEGTVKPQTDDTVARVNEPVVKIAHFLKVTDEMLQDAPAYMAFLNQRLPLGVRLKEQQQLLNGSGTLPQTTGLNNRSGLTTTQVSGSYATNNFAWFDAIYAQITALRATAFIEPDGIVVNSTDWQNFRLAKDKNNQYYAGGPFTGAYGVNAPFNSVDTLWGLKVVQTPAQTQGTALVGGFQECTQLFRRQGITVEMTNSNVDDFQNNLVTVRAEERLALAVYRPTGLGKVTLTA